MLNNRKIKIMTKLALYEQGKGKEDINRSQFYKVDYIRYNILKTIVCITIGYLLIVTLIGLYNVEYFIREATKLNYKAIGTNVLVGYIILVIAYIIYTIITFSVKYDQSKKQLDKYNKGLKELREVYKEEE